MATLFSDNFNRADSTGLGANWTSRIVTDLWNVSSNRAVSANTGGGSHIIFNASGAFSTSDYTVQSIYNPTAGASYSGLGGRRVNFGVSDSDFYLISTQSGSNTIYLHKRVSGSYTQLGTGSVTMNNGSDYTFKLSMNGTTIKAFVDGTEYISVTDSSLAGPGDAGMFQNDATACFWDDFTVDDFGGGGGGAVALPKLLNLMGIGL